MENFKKDIKRILMCALFLLILAILLLLVSYFFAPKNHWESLRQGKTPIANSALDEPDDSIDVLFLGDSLAYSAVSPMELWKEYGFTSFVCASPGLQMASCETLLKEALEDQKPRAVIFEPNALYRKNKSGSGIGSRLEALFCVFTYHDDWKKLDKALFSGCFHAKTTDDYKGFRFNKEAKIGETSEYMKETDKSKDIPAYNEEYFKSIVDICKEAGTELIIVSVPSRKCWNYEKHNGVQSLSEKYGVAYIDLNLMNNKALVDWETDTRDKGDHLNYSGAVKTTKFIGEFLKERYSLPDRRGDSEYAQWNETLERYLNFVEASK